MGRLISEAECVRVGGGVVGAGVVAEAVMLYWWWLRLYLVSREVWRGCRVMGARREVVATDAKCDAEGIGQFRCVWPQYSKCAGGLKEVFSDRYVGAEVLLPWRPVMNAEFVYDRKTGNIKKGEER